MLALMAFLTFLTLVLLVAAQQATFRRDVTRTAAVQQIQKALALYQSARDAYPEFTGCITGQDALVKALTDGKFLEDTKIFHDPKWPDDMTKCLLYKGGGADYSIRYTLESDRVQPKGEHYAKP